MKNFLSLLCILSLCFGCDKAYDLNKIESGDVTIGNDQSEWIMPLAQITVGMDELQDGSADIRAIFDEVDIWLPTTLPGNAEWVDIVRLSSDGTYLDGMLEALIDEMLVPGSKKMDEVVDLIWSNEGYRERFTALIPADSEELFKAEFKKFFGEDNEAGEALRDTMGELAREFLSQIKINTITYNATLDVDDDLIDMLARQPRSRGYRRSGQYARSVRRGAEQSAGELRSSCGFFRNERGYRAFPGRTRRRE